MSRARVVVSSAGVFHAYHLARGAQAGGYLQRFITSIYSRVETGIDRARVVQLRLAGYFARAMELLPGSAAQAITYHLADNLFDLLSRAYVHDADVFHFFNHYGLHAMKTAKLHGALAIVERSSAHPAYHHQLLVDEFQRHGLRYPRAYLRLHAKHVAEYAAADYVMVPSEFVERTMLAAGVPAHKLVRVHLGFDPQRFVPGPKHDSVFRVIYAGGLSLQKGVAYLLAAFAKLRLPNSELLLVGDEYPEARAFLAPYAGAYRHVRFVRQSELPALYQQGSVFVLPSLQDGFGMVVYEAAACGLPVITTDHVGASLRDGIDGFVVPICNADALAERILHLYSHPAERAAMAASAMQYVQQFTWAHYHRELCGLYARLTGSN